MENPAITNADSADTNRNFDKLRSWYLARLRQEVSNRRDLTPATLVRTDSEVIQKMIAEKASEQAQIVTPAKNKPRGLSLGFWIIALSVVPLLIMLPLLVFARQNVLSDPAALVNSRQFIDLSICAMLLIGLFTALVLWREVIRPVSDLRSKLNKLLFKQRNMPSVDVAGNGQPSSSKEVTQVDDLVEQLAKSIEEAIERERAIADYALELICSWDANGKIKAISQASMRLLGYYPEEIIGRTIYEFIAVDDANQMQRMQGDLASTHPRTTLETRMVNRSGRSVDMLWSLDWSRTDQTTFCVGRDITVEKEAERMKEEFLAMIGHDLRTPLAAIYGTLTVLDAGASGNLTDDGRRMVALSLGSATRLMSLINEVLDMEKLRAGKLDINMTEVNLQQVLELSVDSVTVFAQEHGVKIDCAQTEELVQADEGRLIQVVVNLLSNAIKFSPENETIHIEVSPIAEAIEIKVRDHGPGVSRAFQSSIFNRYSQGNAKSSRLTGSGLGLAICKEIIEKHGGTIGVISEEGKGSTFWFRLKAVGAEQ